MNTIDARGLSCPQPVILLKKELSAAKEGCVLLVDNHTAVENCTRFAEHAGYLVSTKDQTGGEFRLTVSPNTL